MHVDLVESFHIPTSVRCPRGIKCITSSRYKYNSQWYQVVEAQCSSLITRVIVINHDPFCCDFGLLPVPVLVTCTAYWRAPFKFILLADLVHSPSWCYGHSLSNMPRGIPRVLCHHTTIMLIVHGSYLYSLRLWSQWWRQDILLPLFHHTYPFAHMQRDDACSVLNYHAFSNSRSKLARRLVPSSRFDSWARLTTAVSNFYYSSWYSLLLHAELPIIHQ